jgi:hypothetical protein
MYTRKLHKEDISVRGESPNGKIPLPLMTKGERFIRCRGQRHGSRGSNGHRDAEENDMFPGGA